MDSDGIDPKLIALFFLAPLLLLSCGLEKPNCEAILVSDGGKLKSCQRGKVDPNGGMPLYGNPTGNTGKSDRYGGVQKKVNCFGQEQSRPCTNQGDTFTIFKNCQLAVRLMCDSTGENLHTPKYVSHEGKPYYCIAGAMYYQKDRVLPACKPKM